MTGGADLFYFFAIQVLGFAAASIWANAPARALWCLVLCFSAAMGVCVVWGAMYFAIFAPLCALLIGGAAIMLFVWVMEYPWREFLLSRRDRALVACVLFVQVLVGFGAAEGQFRVAPDLVLGEVQFDWLRFMLLLALGALVLVVVLFCLLALLWRPARSAELRQWLGALRQAISVRLRPASRQSSSMKSGRRFDGRR